MIMFDRKIIHRLIVIVSISFILILLVNREGISKSTVNRELLCLQPPLVEQGSIDLDNWDLDTHGNVKLDGDWEFYWNQLILPDEFGLADAQLTGHFPVPLYWNKYDALNLSSKGYATYRVVISTSNIYDILSIMVSEIYTDYCLYVNGVKIYSHGSFNERPPKYLKPDVFTFSNQTNTIEIVLQIKNTAHFNAGVGSSLSLGTTENINKERNAKTAIDLIVFTICICAGFYHILLFLFRKRDYRLLCFSILCFIAATRDLFANESYIMQIVPYISFTTGTKIVHSLMPLMVICLVSYTYLTYKDEIAEKCMFSTIGISIVYLFIVLMTNSYTYTILANYYFVISLCVIMMMFYTAISNYRKGNSDALIFASGVSFILLGVMNDMLYYNKLIDTGYWFSIALTMFSITQSVLLSKQYADLIREKNKLYEKLTELNASFLQAQIKPHFIFNALSTISYMSTKEPFKAKELILDLSDYLRGSFEFNDLSGLTKLSNEINLIKTYLAIEKVRYGDRLKIEYYITKDNGIIIPHFCIQPIVENAVKHGIMTKVEGIIIRISVFNIGSATRIIVEDNGMGMSEDKVAAILSGSEKGVGLRNINNRLIHKYGKGLTIKSKVNEGTKIEMMIPSDM